MQISARFGVEVRLDDAGTGNTGWAKHSAERLVQGVRSLARSTPFYFLKPRDAEKRGAMKDIKLPNGRMVSEKEERRFRKLSPKTWEGPPRQLTLKEELEWDEEFRSISVENITAAAKVIDHEEQASPTADRYLATCESVNLYRDSLRQWLDSFTSESWINKDSAMDGLSWNEKLCLFQALLSVAGDCAEEITEEQTSNQTSNQASASAGA